MRLAIYFWLLLVPAGLLRADLARANAEPNLEKRSDLALINADGVGKGLQEQYRSGDFQQVLRDLDEIRASVELAWDSLEKSGKSARRSPKYFKRAEIKTRELIRRLEDFGKQAGVDDRPPVERVVQRLMEIHEDLLLAIMSRK